MIGLHDHLPYRGNYLDLDPNYRDVFGNPLLRMTYDIGPNEHRAVGLHGEGRRKLREGDATQPLLARSACPQTFDSGAGYGIVHQVGGAMTGTSPENSVVNKYLQSWDVPNLFVVGASAFPQISSFNPTGTVGALAYFAADAIKTKYLRHPGPLV